jgi:hypothetical protein
VFTNTTVYEPLLTSSVVDLEIPKIYVKEQRAGKSRKGQQMSAEEKNAILRGAAQTNGNTVNQNMTDATTKHTHLWSWVSLSVLTTEYIMLKVWQR